MRFDKQKEGGVAMIEFSLSIFMLVYIVFLTWEVGNALIVYQKISNISHEGVKIAARSSFLPEGSCKATFEIDEDKNLVEVQNADNSTTCGLTSANGDVRDYVQSNPQMLYSVSQLTVDSYYVEGAEGDTDFQKQMYDKAVMKVSGQYKGLLLPLSMFNIEISVKKTGPYLN